MDKVPQQDDQYRHYVELLLSHHSHVAAGANDSDETEAIEAIEDAMTQLWDELDIDQRRSLSGLSSDLNWVRRRGHLAPRATPSDRVTDADVERAIEASGRGEWHDVLRHLRVCSAKLSPVQVAKLRSTAWQQLGFPQIARQFAGFASELERNPMPLPMPAMPAKTEARAGE